MGAFFNVLQAIVALVALWVAWRALRLSQMVGDNAAREHKRELDHARLMWMQTLLNEVQPTLNARAADEQKVYEDRQRWMLTCLATAGLRRTLPATQELAERPFSEPWKGMVELADRARAELHNALEHAAEKAYEGSLDSAPRRAQNEP
jgi:ABC-type nickel/cobalt efflux system permease component RcnA